MLDVIYNIMNKMQEAQMAYFEWHVWIEFQTMKIETDWNKCTLYTVQKWKNIATAMSASLSLLIYAMSSSLCLYSKLYYIV